MPVHSQWPVVQESASAQQTAFDQFTALTMHHTSSAVNANISFRLKVCGLSQSTNSRWPCDPTPPTPPLYLLQRSDAQCRTSGLRCYYFNFSNSVSISPQMAAQHGFLPAIASRLAEHAHPTNQSARIGLRSADAITNRACLKM